MPRNDGKDRYWAAIDPLKREARKAQMRAYSRNRYAQMKAAGLIQSKRASSLGTIPWRIELAEYVNNHKVSLGECVDCHLPCEQWNVVMFALDHIDPNAKHFTIARANKLFSAKTWKEHVQTELAKCQLLCHNCHAYRTWIERHHDRNSPANGTKNV